MTEQETLIGELRAEIRQLREHNAAVEIQVGKMIAGLMAKMADLQDRNDALEVVLVSLAHRAEVEPHSAIEMRH